MQNLHGCFATESRQRGDFGGERGIRTLGTGLSPYGGLANRWFQPLTHLSGWLTRTARSSSTAILFQFATIRAMSRRFIAALCCAIILGPALPLVFSAKAARACCCRKSASSCPMRHHSGSRCSISACPDAPQRAVASHAVVRAVLVRVAFAIPANDDASFISSRMTPVDTPVSPPDPPPWSAA